MNNLHDTNKRQDAQYLWKHAMLWLTGILALALLPVGSVYAKNLIEAVRAVPLGQQSVEIGFQVQGLSAEPRSFSVSEPPRVILDFSDTGSGLEQVTQNINIGVVRTMDVVAAGSRTRVVINLNETAHPDIRRDGDFLFVTLTRVDAAPVGSNDPTPPPSADAPASVASTDQAQGGTDSASVTAERAITDIQFRRGTAGEARILISLADPSSSVDIKEQRDQLTIDFIGNELPTDLQRRLDVTDFGTVVSFVDAFMSGDNVRLSIDTTDAYTHVAYQTGNLYTIELSKLESASDADEQEAIEFSGERLSLNFQSISTRAVLQIIADFTGLNIVVSGAVGGDLTLRLKNVPWDQALDIILRSQGLSMRRTGNVVLVGTTAEMAEQERLELESQGQLSEIAPLRSETFRIKYSSAEEIAGIISGTGAEETEGGPALLSSRGAAIFAARTNLLIVYDSADRLDQIRSLIAKLDVPVRQVLIESRIINVDDNFARELGTRFGFAHRDIEANGQDRFSLQGNTPGVVSIAAPNPSGNIISGGTDNLVSSLPAASLGSFNPASIFAIFGTGAKDLIQLELSALEQDGRAETISAPRVVTADQQEANIQQGFLIPFQEASSSGATSTSFQEATLSLTVTPSITPDDQIVMDLSVTDDQPAATGGTISTRSVDTNVRVADGETVVLGGVMKSTSTNTTTKVPLLGDIPILGRLFQHRGVVDTKSELLVFITPNILPDQGQ
ncbi:MAG: type IV pilus secretin PilQ [Gammaproteobacteria bacterium]